MSGAVGATTSVFARTPGFFAGAGRGRCSALIGAVLVLVLFVAGGAAVVMDAAMAAERIELTSEVAATQARLAVAGACHLPRRSTMQLLAALPRPTPRTRQVATRGLPPPRAPTA